MKEKYIKWTGNNQEEIIKFLGKRIRKITFKPHLVFNGFHIKRGTWFCENKYGGLDFLTEEGRFHKIILKKYYVPIEKYNQLKEQMIDEKKLLKEVHKDWLNDVRIINYYKYLKKKLNDL